MLNLKTVKLLFLIFIFGCIRKVPFTTDLINQYDLKESDLTSLQYYLSSDVTLENNKFKKGTNITSGGVIKSLGSTIIEEIYIKANSPCVALSTGTVELETSNVPFLNMSFVPEDNINYIGFATTNIKQEDYKFYIILEIFDENQSEDENLIMYDNKKFNVIDPHNAYLMIKKKDLEKIVKKSKKLPGRKIGK